MRILFIVFIVLFNIGCKSNNNVNQEGIKNEASDTKEKPYSFEVNKSDDEWREELSEMEFYVLREAGTERAFTGKLLNNKSTGLYTCAGCGQKLFSSDTKFKSGTGWPSFYDMYDDDNIILDTDYRIGYARTEVLCSRCGGHLGHVFNDGPRPTGKRYCINSAALDFEERD